MFLIKSTEKDEEEVPTVEFTFEDLEELIDPLRVLKNYNIDLEKVVMDDYDQEVSEEEKEKWKEARREIIKEKRRKIQKTFKNE